MKFHEKLFELRKKAGMTQSDLAEKLNVSRQAVSRWEMGTAMPEIDNLITMSDLFGVSLDYMLKDNIEKQAVEQEAPEQSQPDFMTRVRQMKPLEIAVTVVLILVALILLLLLLRMDSSFAGILFLLMIPAILTFAVKMAHYLK